MPYKIRKLPNKNEYEVMNKLTGKKHAFHTTLKKATKQLRLLNLLHNRK